MINYFIYETDIGKIKISEENGKIIGIGFCNTEKRNMDYLENKNNDKKGNVYIEKETDTIKNTKNQIEEYLSGNRKKFDVDIEMRGTDFQKKVWKELMNVPYAETRSYKDIAIDIGNEKACRAVGNANNKNPIAIVVPCHRVIGSDGKMTGYAGGISIKEKLLKIEKENYKF